MTKQDFLSKLTHILNVDAINTIYELDISSEAQTTLLYNTNDLCLNENQFNSLINLISTEDIIYMVQNDSEEVYELSIPLSYNEYKSLDLFSMTFLSSKKFEWVVIVDEELESGIGVIASNKEFIDAFDSKYKSGLNDLHDLISYYYRNASRNPLSIYNLTKILSLLHVPNIQNPDD